MLTDQLGLDVGLDVGQQLGDGERVVEGVRLALGQWALDVVAAVALNTGNWDLETVDLGGDLDFDLLGVLVGNKVSGQLEVLALVDGAGVAGAARQLELGHLVVSWIEKTDSSCGYR